MIEQIEDMRKQLNELIEKLDFDLNNDLIIDLSEKLDILISIYYKDIEL